jgi:hypothetical protein
MVFSNFLCCKLNMEIYDKLQGFTLARTWNGAHQVVEVKPQGTPHHQSGRIELGDEVVQINYQTVVRSWTKSYKI